MRPGLRSLRWPSAGRLCLGLGFERLVTIDILLYGVSLVLEFMALAVLRIREPELARPFRVPGGMFGAIAIGIPPMLLLGFSVVRSEHEQIWDMSSFTFGMILIGAGVVAYFINHVPEAGGMDGSARGKAATCSLNTSRAQRDFTDLALDYLQETQRCLVSAYYALVKPRIVRYDQICCISVRSDDQA